MGEVSAGTPSQHPLSRRGGFGQWISTLLGAAAGIGVAAVGTTGARLLFDNAYGLLGYYGPLGEQLPKVIGRSATYACAAAAGLATAAMTRWLARRTRVAVLSSLVFASAAIWLLYPQQIDVHESFWPMPNERYSCTGLTIRYYPPATSDASETLYCLGLEHRISDG